MIDLTKIPAREAEAIAYAEGFTGTAELFARIQDLEQEVEFWKNAHTQKTEELIEAEDAVNQLRVELDLERSK